MTRFRWPQFSISSSASEVVSTGGMVVGPDQRIAEAGATVLRQGGNAVDAAVAAAFATAVVEPWAAGLGGSATMTLARRDLERCAVVEGHMVSPAGVRFDQYPLADGEVGAELIEQAFGLAPVVDQANLYGGKAVAAPGAVACLTTAHERYGSLPREQVMAPAIALATDGFRVNYLTAAFIAGVAARACRDPALAEVFYPGGLPLRGPGSTYPDRLVQPALARTLEAIAAGGAAAFYRGQIARSLVERIRRDGGVLALEDLEAYRAAVLDPVRPVRFREIELFAAPTSGLPTILEALRIYDAQSPGPREEDEAVAWARALYLAFTDRSQYLTHDPDYTVPWDGIASDAYAQARLDAELGGREPPDPGDFDPTGPVGSVARPASGVSGHTSHLTAVDQDGNVAALTSTLLNTFGSLAMDGETGVVLNGGMAYFDPRPGARNSIKPGVPVLSAMTPIILSDRTRGPFAGLGASGGRMIISGLAQIVAALAGSSGSLQEVVEAPRIHAESKKVLLDARWSQNAAEAVAAAGFEVQALAEGPTTGNFARPNGVLIDAAGLRRSGVDPKKPAGIALP